MKQLHNLLRILLEPLRNSRRMCFTVWFCCVMIVVFGNIYLHYEHESVFITSLCVVFDVYVLACCVRMVPAALRRWVRGGIYILLYASLLIELFLIFTYKTFVRPFAVLLFMESDGRESSEFFCSLWHLPGTYYALLALAVLAGCSALVYAWLVRLGAIRHRWLSGLVLVVLCWSATREAKNYVRVLASLRKSDAASFEFGAPEAHYYSPFSRLIGGCVYFRLLSDEYAGLDRTVAATTVGECRYTSPVIVLIIGESYNKHHSPLYNPHSLNTTPRLCRMAEDSLLYVFTDVVSVSNRTTEVFRNIFSMDSLAGGNVRYTLFPAIFKKAGYDVAFISNQFVRNARLDKHDVCGGAMFNFGDLSHNQFTSRNEEQYRYDHELLQVYDTMQVRKDGPMLAVFHLLGQHLTYNLRYPPSYAYFTEDSVSVPYGKEASRITADYENSLRYNDEVVASIIRRFADKEAIVIYLSDHGEQVFDGVDYWARSYEMPMLWTTAKYQHEVPFLIYMSPRYQEEHPEIAGQVRSARMRPFITNDLPHILLYLAGISHPDYDETRNLLSPAYDCGRKRLLRGKVDYDEMKRTQAAEE